VVSPHTSFLVLETEADYRRFHIDRRAKLDILTVADGKIAVVKRARSGDDEDERDGDKRKAARDDGPTDPHIARQQALREAAEFGSIGLLPSPSESASGPGNGDPMSARGNMWGDAIGDSFGAGGLGLSGVGEGGGGRGEGIGLGSIGSIGHGAGTGQGQGFGSGHGRLGGAHATSAPTLRGGIVEGGGRLPPEVIQRIVRQNFGRYRLCYEQGLRTNPTLAGRVDVRFLIDRSGSVSATTTSGFSDAAVASCIARSFRNLSFPQPEDGVVTVTYGITMQPPGSGREAAALPPTRWATGPGGPLVTMRPGSEAPRVEGEPPYEGKLKGVMSALAEGKVGEAKDLANAWQKSSPTDVLSLVALGETAEKSGDPRLAARAYGSIIDLFGFRADSRRFAGVRLERLGDRGSLELAADSYAKAVEQRPDHPAGHRLLAYALLKLKKHEQAFEACAKGLARDYPSGRFAGVKEILAEDLGLIAAAWKKAEPQRAAEIDKRLADAHGTVENTPSLRFVLNWETDANDVDFHIRDARGGHAFYGNRELRSGGHLYADVTTGYGPECFTIRTPKAARAYPYTLEAHYFARGPMGYGMGKLQIVEHDGDGNLTFEERPYVVMVDHAYVDLGKVTK
jgi:tetratricopeptide (TPR) repeat protein